MIVASYMLCDSINNVNLSNGTTVPQLVMPKSVLRPQYIPSTFSFGISVSVWGMDLSKKNTMRFKISDPDGNTIQESNDNELPASVEDSFLPEEYQGFTVSIDIRNLNISKSGVYKFALSINGEEICIKDIPVYEARKQ